MFFVGLSRGIVDRVNGQGKGKDRNHDHESRINY